MRRSALTSILTTENTIRGLALDSYRRWATAARNLVLPVLGAAVAGTVAEQVQDESGQPVIPPDVAALVAAYALWDNELDDGFLPGFGALLDALVAAALTDLGLAEFDTTVDGQRRTVTAEEATHLVPPLMSWRATYLAAVRDRLTGMPATTQRELSRTIDQHAAQGATVRELRQLAAEELTVRHGSRWDRRADNVARTEATGARNSAVQAAAVTVRTVTASTQQTADNQTDESGQPGQGAAGQSANQTGKSGQPGQAPAARSGQSAIPEYEKVWLSLHDGRTRPTHAAANGQRVPLDAQFRVGTADLAYPGDPTGPPGEVCGCRCAIHVVRVGDPLPILENGITASAAPEGVQIMARTFEALLMPTGVIGRSGMSMLSPTVKLVDTALPLALKWQREDLPAHDGGLTVGAIEALEIRDNGLYATGTLLDGPDTEDALQQIAAGVTRPSAELVVREETLTDDQGTVLTPQAAEQVWMDGGMVVMRMDQVEIVGGTLVSVPEFRDTSITVSDATDSEAPDLALVAAATTRPDLFDASMFEDPHLSEPTPIHVTPDGRVLGHIAAWESVHRAVRDRWGGPVHPFRSNSGYSEFHQSKAYLEPDGQILRVGRLTVGGGHATPGRGVQAAIAHHDDVSTCWAYVRAGEDAHGIWISGVVNPQADPAMVKQALTAPISGHWEPVAGHPELIIAHSVNNPGFAFRAARDRDGDLAMVASFAPRQSIPPVSTALLEDVARRAVAEYAEQQAGQQRAAAARELVTAASGRRRRVLADAIRESEVRRGVRV